MPNFVSLEHDFVLSEHHNFVSTEHPQFCYSIKIPKIYLEIPPGKKLSGSAHDSSENTWIIRYLSQSSRASRSFLKSGQIFLASRKSPLLHFFSHQGELSRGLEFWRLTILFVVVFLGVFLGGMSICPPPPTARPALPQFFKKMLPACMCM